VKLLAATNQIDKAKSVLAKLKQEEPDNTYIQELEAIIAFIDKDYAKSVELYKKALSKRATNILTIRLATAMKFAGDTSGSLEVLKNWLDKYPDDTLTRSTYADALLSDKQYQQARDQYLRVIQIDKDNISALNNLAWLNMQLGDLDKAVDYAGQASIKAPENPAINDTFATILIRQKEYKRALDILRTASAKVPQNLDIQFHLAQALYGVGKKQEAIGILKIITQPGKTYNERENAIKLLQELS
jgi:predicted Zn-dependent protease